METKKRVLVIGGMDKNIPTWIHKTFEVEHYEQETHFKRAIAPKERPDVVIVLKSWISHKQCADAKDYATKNNIPFIMADGGWAMAVQRAVEAGLDWFAHDIDKSLGKMAEPVKKEADEVVERAWEGAYKREFERSKAFEKRHIKDREKLEKAEASLAAAEKREDAAERVIAKIREAAQERKQDNERTKAEVQKIAREVTAKIDSFLKHHETVLESQLKEVTELRKTLKRLMGE